MTHPVALPGLNYQWTEPFRQRTHLGLFAAPWLGTPSAAEVALIEESAGILEDAAVSHAHLPAILSGLLTVRANCLLAAQSDDATAGRAYYGDALKECQLVLNRLTAADDPLFRDLAAWAAGVRTLILAQKAMPDVAESRRLAEAAAEHLSHIRDPICAGAKVDAGSARTLARVPGEITHRLENRSAQLEERLAHVRGEVQVWEQLMNNRLAAIRQAHLSEVKAVFTWGLIQILCMASLPLNGAWYPAVPWSLPLVLAVPGIWWWTWSRPFRDGKYFFEWLHDLRDAAVEEFRADAARLPDPTAHFQEACTELQALAYRDIEQLRLFHLFTPPSRLEEQARIAPQPCDSTSGLTGAWMIELDDRAPLKLADVINIEPPMMPHGTRIYFGR